MPSLVYPFRLVSPALLLLGMGLPLSAQVQAQANEPPANYRGPDTYGMCVYVIGDTTYYGHEFYTSSYFKIKAEQEARSYAQAQASGAPVKARCFWSYKESDLALAKETDRRLLGLPGHSAKGVDSGWTFHGGTVGASPATTATNGAARPLVPAASSTAANNATRPVQNAYTRPVNGTSTATNAAYTNAAATNANNRALPYAKRTAATAGSTGTATSSQIASNTPATTASNGASSTTSTLLGGTQQSLSDAKTNAVSTAATGMNTMTSNAMNGLSSGMQNMFHRKQAQPQTQAQQGAAQGSGSGGAVQNAGAPPAGGGFGMDTAPVEPSGAPSGGGTRLNAAAGPVEGLVADVSGMDVIINIGQQAGIQPGTTLAVTHAQRTVKDPATGKVLRTVESQVGELKITSADAGSATGTFSGSGTPAVGDKVRTK